MSATNFPVLLFVYILTVKRMVGEGWQFGHTCGFPKNVTSKERVKPWFFVAFNIIISYIFPKNFIVIPQVAQTI